jgi:hypothetical protein
MRKIQFLAILLLTILLSLPVLAHTDGQEAGEMMSWDNMMGMNCGGIYNFLLGFLYLVWLAVGILAAVWLWRQITK